MATAWPEDLGPVPAELADMQMLRLTPGRHGTDGFFVAVMERAAKPDDAQQEKDNTP